MARLPVHLEGLLVLVLNGRVILVFGWCGARGARERAMSETNTGGGGRGYGGASGPRVGDFDHVGRCGDRGAGGARGRGRTGECTRAKDRRLRPQWVRVVRGSICQRERWGDEGGVRGHRCTLTSWRNSPCVNWHVRALLPTPPLPITIRRSDMGEWCAESMAGDRVNSFCNMGYKPIS